MGDYRERLSDDEVVKGYSYPIEIKVYKDGAQQVPSSATITVKDDDGKKLVENATMNVDGQSGTMTYTLASTLTTKLLEDGVIEVEYTISSVKYKMVRFYQVVLNKLRCSVVDDDLQGYFPSIHEELWEGDSNYDTQIEEAFRLVKRDIRNKGRRPHMLIDGDQVRELVIMKTFELIFFDFSKARSDEDKWWVRYEEMKERYGSEFSKLNIKYDEDQDGLVDQVERGKALGQIRFQR